MAQEAPSSIDMLDIQFKIHNKFTVHNASNELRSNVNLLAISSSRGLLFAGNPHAPELKVLIIKDLVVAKEQDKKPLARLVSLPNAANAIACSSDGNLLAVNFTQNTSGVLNIYSVQSFTSAANLNPLYSIRISPEDHVYAVQLLWNPVLPNNIAVVLSNGGLSMYVLKDEGNFEFHSLDKSQQVKCGCWSPKGKQIALGFPNGKLQQFKPDLTPAKTIICPPNVHSVPFDTIGIHWLSTFQFAVIFLQHGEDCSPSLYIVNAPKVGTPSYINYFDICYSGNGPRNHQFGFTHIQSWNLLLVTSANGVEVGLLGTKETTDTPSWLQYNLLDEARIEMPLSDTKDETFPMGFVYDTSSTHQLTISEKLYPTMPMIHVLSTDGTLICFNFLNLKEGAASVCSPPPPIADTSGQFRTLDSFIISNAATKPATDVTAAGDMTFAFTPNTVTSTPSQPKDKPVSLFGGFNTNQSSEQSTLGFGSAVPAAAAAASSVTASIMPAVNYNFGGSAAPAAAPSLTAAASSSVFGGLNLANTLGTSTIAPNASPFGGITAGKPQTFAGFAKPNEPTPSVGSIGIAAPTIQPSNGIQNSIQPSVNVVTTTAIKPADLTKPLYSVPATFTPPAATNGSSVSGVINGEQREMSEAEVDKIVKEIMAVQITAFSNEIQQLKQQTNSIFTNIGNPNEIKSYTKRLNDLQEINDQAKDQEFELDLQSLRYSMNESYGMLGECRSKLEVYKNPDMAHLMVSNNFDPINRRQLRRLQSYVTGNEAQLHILQQQIDQQWEHYQDVIRRSSKLKMHMPCLEGIYQRMTKLQNLLSDRRIKLNNIKTKLKDRGIQLLDNNHTMSQTKINIDATVESLAESILSINLTQTVIDNQSKLSADKLQSIRQMTQNQKIRLIKPLRPDRVGLNSEVILETKRKAERLAAAAKIEKEQKDKAAAAAATTKSNEFITPSITTKPEKSVFAAPSSFSFANSSSFVKTTVSQTITPNVVTAAKTISTELPIKQPTSSIFSGFGTANAAKTTTTTASSIFSFSQAAVGSLATSTTTPSAPFGSTSIAGPSFGSTNAAAPAFGSTSVAAPAFGSTSVAAPSFGSTSVAAPSFGSTSVAAPSFGSTSVAAPSFPSTSVAAPAFGSTSVASSAFGSTSVASSAFGSTSVTAPPFGTTSVASPAFGSTSIASSAFGSTSATAPLFGGSTSIAAPAFGGSTSVAAPPANSLTTATINSTSLFAGIGSNVTITKVGSVEKDLKSFEFAPTSAPQPTSVSLFAGTNKTSDSSALTKPFQTSLFNTNTTTGGGFGGSTTGNTLSFGGSAIGSGINFGAFGSALGASNAAASSTSTSAAPGTGVKTTFSFATIPATITSVSNSLPTSASTSNKNLFGDMTKKIIVDLTTTTTTSATAVISPTSPIDFSLPATVSTTVAPSASDVTAETPALPLTTETTSVNTSSAVIVPNSTLDSSVSITTIASTSVASSAETTNTTATLATDSVDKVLGSVNICKPMLKDDTKDTNTSNANGFIGFGAASGFSFASSSGNSLMTTKATESSPFSATSIAAPSTSPISSRTTATSNGVASVAPPINSFSFASALSALSVPTDGASITTTMPATITSGTAATTITSPTSIFGVAAQSPSPFQSNTATSSANGTQSLFGGKGSATNGSIFATANQPVAASAAPPTSANSFGSLAKPEQSVFGCAPSSAPPTGLFASAAAQIPSPFSSPQTSLGGGSIFGGTANAQSPVTSSVFGSGGGGDGSSIFGGGSASNSTPFGSNSIFGGGSTATNAVKPPLFGAQQTNQNVPAGSGTSPGSIFGQSVFSGTATGGSSIFGGAATSALPQQQQQTNPFGGTGNSIFGGGGGNVVGSNATNAGGSIFGGGSTNSGSAFGSNAFGSFTSPTVGGGGAFSGGGSGTFAQGGASVSQTGFGSPPPQQQQQQQSAFGSAPAFGSPAPAFGASPTFGGAATFGSPKGFTSFGTAATPTAANAAAPSAFGGQTQKNNLFETLGSTDTGLSFGNLAQSGLPNSQKPSFGGSSFMNYRA